MTLVRREVIRRIGAVLAAAAWLAACSGGGGGSPTPRVDPNAPDEVAFQAARAHYDAATAAQAAWRNPLEPDPGAQLALAVSEFTAAKGAFRQFAIDYPSSIRADNAAYLEGRSAYELGTTTGARADHAEAWELLQAAMTRFAASPLLDSMAYFAGRALYEMAAIDRTQPGAATEPVETLYALAWEQFDRSAAANPGAPWGDNAAYYRGRCDYEMGFLDVHPLEPGAAPHADAGAHFDRAETELAAIPAASTYYDNARYYLGRSHVEEPATATAARRANLDAAIAALGAVPAASPYADGALYWRGRARFEAGDVLMSPLEPLATPPAPGDTAYAAAVAYFDAAEVDLFAVPQASVYYDNARYYRGRSLFDEPAQDPAARQANLDAAIGELTLVLGLPGPSAFAAGATYWRGRCHYALAFQLGSGGAADPPELALTLADMKAVAGSQYEDNGLYFVAKAYLNFGAPGPYCELPRSEDAAAPPASACAAYQLLAVSYAASVYTTQASAYMLSKSCEPATCPP